MKQRKSILLTALAVLLVFGLVFAGCSDGSSSKTPNTPDTPDPIPEDPPTLPVIYNGLFVTGASGGWDAEEGNWVIEFDSEIDVTEYNAVIVEFGKNPWPTYGWTWFGGQVGLSDLGTDTWKGVSFWGGALEKLNYGILLYWEGEALEDDDGNPVAGTLDKINEIVFGGALDGVTGNPFEDLGGVKQVYFDKLANTAGWN